MKPYFLALVISLFFSTISQSNESDYRSNNFGAVGLIETPTARFSEDGVIGFGLSASDPYNRLYTNMQFLPWLEVVVRYTEIEGRPYYTGNPQSYKDKSADIKLKILSEGKFVPELALGLMDIGGSNLFASEYIVGTKKLGNFDLSFGMGWGRMATRGHINNPFNWFFDSKGRSTGMTGREVAGAIDPGIWFTGDKVGLFGGLEYRTPIDNLRVQIEYDPNDYEQEIGDTFIDVDSPINLGLTYQINTSERGKADIALGLVRGNTIYANLQVKSNLNMELKSKFQAPLEQLNKQTLEPFNELNNNWQKYLTDKIIWQLGNEGFVTHDISFIGNDTLQARISQGRFRKTLNAIDTASRVLANNAPKNIKNIEIINVDQGLETLHTSIPIKKLQQIVRERSLSEEDIFYFPLDKDNQRDQVTVENEYLYPNFYWEIRPNINGSLGGPIKFYWWQLEALIHTEYSFKKGLYLTTDIGIDIYNNWEKWDWHGVSGDLHRVRSDRRLYLREGENGIRKMQLDYLFAISSNITAKITAGLFEKMYGGIGGEVLYLPDTKSWGIGMEAYWVKQRDFDQMFSFLDYQNVTGHLNFYYDLPFYNLRLKTSIGKFLAKDKGVNVDISRRFKSGTSVGAMVSLTDCDSECFGEGSFNKWIYFTMPMDFSYSTTTRNKTNFGWSPLTRDGGVKVEPGKKLYPIHMDARDELDILRKKELSIVKIFKGFSRKPKQSSDI